MTRQLFRIWVLKGLNAFSVFAALSVFVGCSNHAVKAPVLATPGCPASSYELPKVTHCFDPPKCTHTESWDGELCMAYDPETKKPLGVFFKGHCNPYLSPDCDDPDESNGKHKSKEND